MMNSKNDTSISSVSLDEQPRGRARGRGRRLVDEMPASVSSIEIQSLLSHLGVPANTKGEQGRNHRWSGEIVDQKVLKHIFCFAPK